MSARDDLAAQFDETVHGDLLALAHQIAVLAERYDSVHNTAPHTADAAATVHGDLLALARQIAVLAERYDSVHNTAPHTADAAAPTEGID